MPERSEVRVPASHPQYYSVRRKEDGVVGGPDGSWCPSQEGGWQRRRLKDGGVRARVERDGWNCGGGERRGDEGWRHRFHKVLLERKLSLNRERDSTYIWILIKDWSNKCKFSDSSVFQPNNHLISISGTESLFTPAD